MRRLELNSISVVWLCAEINCGKKSPDAESMPEISTQSIEVVSWSCRSRQMKWFDSAGFHGNNPILVLQYAFHHQKRIMNNNRVVFLEKLWCYDDIRDSGFVL